MSELLRRLEKIAKANPGAPAIAGLREGDSLSFADLMRRVDEFSTALQLDTSTRVALCADNSPLWVIADLACQRSGSCLVPLPGYFSTQQRQHALDDAGIYKVITDNPATFSAHGFTASNSLIDAGGLVLMNADTRIGSKSSIPIATAKITYTSGSTGSPRGVCLSATHITGVADAIVQATSECEISRHLCVLPLPTLLENIAGVYAPLLSHAEVVIPGLAELGFEGSSQFDLTKLLGCIDFVKPNSLILIPQLLEALLHAAAQGWRTPSSLRFVAVGGGRVSSSLLFNAQRLGVPVFQGYGLSECASVVSLNLPGSNRTGSVGKPLAPDSVRIDDGEIVVKGNQFLGYSGDWDTRSTNTEGVRTGDLGYFDNEGYLYINGRKKNLLISSFGRNISPEWVESEISSATEILQCAVFGDARPCCVALVFPRKGTVKQSIKTAIETINKTLPDYARVQRWYELKQPFTVASGTLTSNGRLRRDVIEKLYRDEIYYLYGADSSITKPESPAISLMHSNE